MDYLPLFAAVKDRPVLVIGGGEIAARKITFLRRAGAHVQIVARRLDPQLQQLADEQAVHWIATEFDESQLDAVFLVIAATNDSALNRRVFDAANARHRLVNVVDDQPLCSFIFPSIVDRSPLIVAISSGGNAPVLARLLREKIEALLPGNLGRMAAVAGRWRTRIKAFRRTTDDRRRFWESAFRGRFASLMAAGDEPAAERALEAELQQPGSACGEIILVGAGPGDAGLLTLRGLQVIQQADVVFYDHLVSDAVLELTRRDAEKICVGKRAGVHAVPQHETNRMLVEAAQEGKTVVRLKGGDPFIFGRGGEEMVSLQQADIVCEVVPGITAAVGCAAASGIPLTHRDCAQSLRFITGHGRSGEPQLDAAALAASNQTLVFYMGLSWSSVISSRLREYGRREDTPVAIIENGTRQDQRVLVTTLAGLPETIAQHKPVSPSLLIVGDVVRYYRADLLVRLGAEAAICQA